MNTIAKINEIFYSYQGEGIYQGQPQVFIRFSGCNLKCIFCDTAHLTYRPFTVTQLLQEVLLISKDKPLHSISLTGGEPLYQQPFLLKLLPALKREGYRIYLETNGILYKELSGVLPYLDIIAMDFKLPTSTGMRPFWTEHKRFLKIGLAKDIFVKAVITDSTSLENWQQMVDIVYEIDPRIPLVLQPVTPTGACTRPSPEKIHNFREIALEKLSRVEVLPQLHSFIGIK